MRELFIYYRIPVVKAETALEAAHAFQARLCARHPGLTARLLRRPEVQDSQQTWMETYSFDPISSAGGVTPECQSDIEREARCMNDLIAGARHTEVFVACAS